MNGATGLAAAHIVTDLKLIGPDTNNTDGVHSDPAFVLRDSFIVAGDDAIDLSRSVYSEVTNSVVWNTWGSSLLLFQRHNPSLNSLP